MLKRICKTIVFTAFAVMTCIICCFGVFAADEGISDFSVIPFETEAENSNEIKWWKNDVDGKYYFFLPTGTELSELTVNFNSTSDVLCGETVLKNGEKTNVFADAGEYTIKCGSQSYTFVFLTSGDIPTVFIDTESGSLDYIHLNKDNKESGTAFIIDTDGTVMYDGELDYIKGRGNSTWKLPKKAYNIKLEKKADLFGMGKSKKWCFLANASDLSMIRNQLAYDLALNIGVPYTSETAHFNYYINGEYQGVYLLTEKVEIGENRVDIFELESETEDVNSEELDSYPLGGALKSMVWNTVKYAKIPNNPDEIKGGYLLELEKIYRYPEEVSGFITRRGQAVVVKEPEYASKSQVNYISTYYQDFEDALYAADGYNAEGKHFSDYIDMESLAKMYIMNEFTSNFDNCSSSFYLSKDVDGKLKAGPLWDYDLSLGYSAPNHLINHVENMGDTGLLYTKTCFIGNHNERNHSLLAQAYRHNEFQNLVSKIWKENVLPYYETFTGNITSMSDSIRSSVRMNSVRWNVFWTPDHAVIEASYNGAVDNIKGFAASRFDFINKAFAEDTYYVKYDIGDFGAALVNDNNLYKNGDTATVLSVGNISPNAAVFLGWNDKPDGSGKTYQPGDEITVSDNTVLYAQWSLDDSLEAQMFQIQKLFSKFISILRELIDNLPAISLLAQK